MDFLNISTIKDDAFFILMSNKGVRWIEQAEMLILPGMGTILMVLLLLPTLLLNLVL